MCIERLPDPAARAGRQPGLLPEDAAAVRRGDDVGMVLSPQSLQQRHPHADIFNHGNVQFWEYAQHGYDAIGFISCTGAPAPLTVSSSPVIA